MSKTFYDAFPKYQTAGFMNRDMTENARQCIQPEKKEIPETPINIRKYRHTYKGQHGQKILHYGVVQDRKRPESHTYGKEEPYSGTVKELFMPKNQKVQEMINDIYEKKYASQKTEPLAKTINRNYNLPKEAKDPNFEYGVRTVKNNVTTTEVLFPSDLPFKENEQDAQKYLKSHQTYQPGEQKNRNYSWQQVNLKNHTFGKSTGVDNQMQNILFHDNFNDKFPQTRVVKKNQEDFKAQQYDDLGKTKNLFQVNPYVQEKTIYGSKLPRDDWNAYDCIRGDANLETNKIEENLGKATKHGFKNETKQGDENRVFGIPTLRHDINRKTQKSVADHMNYGDEPDCIQVIFPQKYEFMGLSKEDFIKLRDKQEIKDIFESVNIKYKVGKFEAVFIKAQQIEGSSSNQVSVKAFLTAVQEMHNIQ